MIAERSSSASVPPSQPREGWLLAFENESAQLRDVVVASEGKTLRLLEAPRAETTHVTGHVTGAGSSACGVAFAGRLDARERLAQAVAPTPSSHLGDAELILAAYRRWGEGVLPYLRGAFALCLWDGSERRLLCVRDPLGMHPLFYARSEKRLLFSDSIETLLRQPGVSRALNRATLAEFLYDRQPALEETFFAGVGRVPPGHAMIVTDGGSRLERYFDPVPPQAELTWEPEVEQERFEALLLQAVARCLHLGRVGIFLSGGLDSCSVATAAADLSHHYGYPPPCALSLSFPDPEWREEKVQKGLALALGLPQSFIPYQEASGPEGELFASLALCRARPAPLINTALPAYMRLARRGKQLGCEVVLGGEGGDEWLSYAFDPRLAADLVRTLQARALARLLHHIRAPTYEAAWLLLWRHGARPLLAGMRQRLVPRRPHAFPSLPAWFLPDPALRKTFLERRSARREARAMHVRNGFYRAAVRATLDHPLHTLDKEQDYEEGQRLGVRFLSPFWDADLIAGLVRSPLLLASSESYSKAPLRRYLQRRVPELDFARYRKSPPLHHYSATIVASARRYWLQQPGFTGLHALGLADTAQLEQQTTALFDDDAPEVTAAERLWRHLNVDTWVRSRL